MEEDTNETSDSSKTWRLVLGIVAAIFVVIGAAAWLTNTFLPADAASGHHHGAVAAAGFGEPGDPKLPSRDIAVSMSEGQGTMAFTPAMIEVKQGEQIRFKLTNTGAADHEFVLATLQDNLAHLEEMKAHPDMKHEGDKNSLSLAPGASGEVLWKFTKAGTFDFSCLIPGHREAGMHGAIVVK